MTPSSSRLPCLVQGRDLAAGAEAGVDGQHAAAAQRRLQQQAAQVRAKTLTAWASARFGQLAADLALQAGQQQPGQGVAGHVLQEVGVRMVGQRQPFQGRLLHARPDRSRA